MSYFSDETIIKTEGQSLSFETTFITPEGMSQIQLRVKALFPAQTSDLVFMRMAVSKELAKYFSQLGDEYQRLWDDRKRDYSQQVGENS